MCSPAAIPMAIQAGGGLLSYNSTVQAGKDERNYYNMSADTDEANAAIVKIRGDRQVTNIQDRAAFDNAILKDQVKEVEGSQKVVAAVNGVGAGSVSAEDIARDTMTKAEKDEALIRYNADLSSDEVNRNTNFEVAQLKQSARLKRYSGKMAQKAAKMRAFTTIIGTSAQVADKGYSLWNQYKKTQPKSEGE